MAFTGKLTKKKRVSVQLVVGEAAPKQLDIAYSPSTNSTGRVGVLCQEVLERIETLPLEQLENLGEALLDFTSMADLQANLETLEG